MSDTRLEDILKECTGRENVPLTENERLFENLWKEQQNRLSEHDKYIAESIQIQPIAVFVCKARMKPKDESTAESQKVFLNICSHHMVPNLSISEIDVHQNGIKQKGVRVPVSCGPRMKVKDNKGNDAFSFDVVFHPDVIEYGLNDDGYKVNICMTAAQNISQKENIIIDGPYKFPKLAYKGVDDKHKQPLTQRIRKKGAAKFVQEDDAVPHTPSSNLSIQYATNKASEDDDSKADSNCMLQHDFYILFSDKSRKKLWLENMSKLSQYLMTFENKEAILNEIIGIQIHINLTKRFKLSDLDLNMNKSGIHLTFNGKVLFEIQWNQICEKMTELVSESEIVAKFIKKKHLMKLKCPFVKP